MKMMSNLSMTQPFIDIKGLQKSYGGADQRVTIFDSLDMQIAKGDFVAIMGPSGSGKSTLLNMLGGIDKPDQGQLTIGQFQLSQRSEAVLTQWRGINVGIVFQFYNLLPMLTAEQNIELPLLLKDIGRSGRKVRVDSIMKLVGIEDRRSHLPSQLSGGQQQRVGIARALVSDPQLLLCDEPTGDLDRKAAAEVMEMLSFLNKELGKTIVMVTHDPEACAYATRTLHLNKGFFEEQEVAA